MISILASGDRFNFAGNENSCDSCRDGTHRTGRSDTVVCQPASCVKNACTRGRIEPLSPGKLRDTLSRTSGESYDDPVPRV